MDGRLKEENGKDKKEKMRKVKQMEANYYATRNGREKGKERKREGRLKDNGKENS